MDRFRRRTVGAFSTAIAVGTLVIACTPDDVTRAPTPVVSEPLALAASAGDLGAAGASLHDARSRVAPALERLATEAELSDRLEAVEQAVRAGDRRQLEHALGRAERTLARLRDTGNAAATADLDAISFALADAKRLLSPSSRSRSVPASTSTGATKP